MAKRRQQDFSKTQLKPGRSVGRRRNLTNTNFKSKKIGPLNKAPKHKGLFSKTIPDCLKRIKESSHFNAKTSALNDLNKQIDNAPTLSLFLSDVLALVLSLTVEADENVRNAATEVVVTILAKTDDLQIESFATNLINVLSCSMTHPNIRIKEHSLKLLKPMLVHHPALICHSMTILNNLLQMLSGTPRTRTHSQTPKSKNYPFIYDNDMYSQDWRIHILAHINLFLTEMLRRKLSVSEDDHDEQEIYWDSKEPLYLQIFAGSGLKPLDIEKSYSGNINSKDIYDDPEKFLTLINNIMGYLSAIFAEEMASDVKSDDKLLSSEKIKNLSILFQLLSSIIELLKFVPSEGIDKEIKKFLKMNVYEKGRFPFSHRGAMFLKGDETLACVSLNLAICYLYCTYLLKSVKDKEKLCEYIFSYVEDVFKMSFDVKYRSIPMLVKIIKAFFTVKETPEISAFLHASLVELCVLLNLKYDDPYRKLLTSFFAKMSLNSAYYFLTETGAIDYWFEWLLDKLVEIPETGDIDRKILKVMKKIASRRFQVFQKQLMSLDFCVIKSLLKYNDDEVCDTTIFLICNMRDISAELLNNIARLILLDTTFPETFSIRMIRLIKYRFLEVPRNEEIPIASVYNENGLMNITQFLLNIAIDSVSINNEKLNDFEANEYTKGVKIFKDVAPFCVLPSLQWKKHSVLFEVCDRLLYDLPEDTVVYFLLYVYDELKHNCNILPMTTAIALLKLGKSRGVQLDLLDLVFSAFLTVSVITQMPEDEDWYECNVMEVTNSILLDGNLYLKSLQTVHNLKSDQVEGIAVYHMLRVCNYTLALELMQYRDRKNLLQILETLKEICSDKTIGQQPLYKNILYHISS